MTITIDEATSWLKTSDFGPETQARLSVVLDALGQNQWTSVETPPTEDGTYFILPYFSVGKASYTAAYGWHTSGISHWMAIPPKPEPEAELQWSPKSMPPGSVVEYTGAVYKITVVAWDWPHSTRGGRLCYRIDGRGPVEVYNTEDMKDRTIISITPPPDKPTDPIVATLLAACRAGAEVADSTLRQYSLSPNDCSAAVATVKMLTEAIHLAKEAGYE
jgi:hypothetical protein